MKRKETQISQTAVLEASTQFCYVPHSCYINCLSAGLKELGELLLSKFKWGKTFFNINRDVLDLYAACQTSADVVAAQRRHLDELEQYDRAQCDRGLETAV